ncbi:serine/threonine-protein kinase pim-2-like [Thunnus albacares]|uniref:serine/threonine-protein kinase pim-2-like n=1 Tax=Thunnus albacares TaxID=8236 RepID=UPI001CF6CCBD|nr:serine/threonine-protein kinase pim-2-like [Thunnus albacares]XP_044218442.1 serine/threonine-protein kinase pim-2-like [Thunnus albacares]
MMASTSIQTHEHLASGKTQDNNSSTIEPDYDLMEDFRERRRKRKASGDREKAKKRHRGNCNSKKNPNTCEPGNVSTEDVRAKQSKRKASPDRETPKKRRRGSCSEPSNELMEVSSRGGERKASTDRESSQYWSCQETAAPSSSSKPNEVLVEDVQTGQRKRKASTDRESSRKKYRSCQETAAPSSCSKPKEVEDVKRGKRKRKASTGKETPTKRQKGSKLKQSSCRAPSSQEEKVPAVITNRADFETKYKQLDKIGEGGFGSVYAGYRITDSLPVALKYIQGPDVDYELKMNKIPLEVALMLKVAGGPESLGKCAAVSLLDWYYLDQTLILVMERPVPSMDLSKYLRSEGGRMEEHTAKIFMTQLVDAASEMLRKGVFHRDIKSANVLVEVDSSVPRVRIIDFGCSCSVQREPYRYYCGTLSLAPPEWHMIKKYKAGSTTVWQLGAMLYRLLHGYRFDTMSFVTDRIQLSSELSEDCLDFLELCLAIRPKERPTVKQLKFHPWLQ